MRYTLRQLQIFIEIARVQNVSRAAKSLHVSQSAANEALLNLERAFEFELFDRLGNRLSLNRHGERVLREADKLMQRAHAFEESVLQIRPSPDIRVGASFTIGNHLATKAMAMYLEVEPNSTVDLQIGSTPDIVEKVAQGNVDVGMVEWPQSHPDVVLAPWRDDELVVFVAADHVLAKKGTLSEDDVVNARWILREPNSGLGHAFNTAMNAFYGRYHVFLELRHNEAIKTAVESGLGVGCLSKIAVQRDIESGTVVPLTIPGVDLTRRFYFVMPKRATKRPAIELWLSVCAQLN